MLSVEVVSFLARVDARKVAGRALSAKRQMARHFTPAAPSTRRVIFPPRPNTEHVKKALNSLEFLVVQEIFMSETAKFANVVLPGASFFEKSGTFTNAEDEVAN